MRQEVLIDRIWEIWVEKGLVGPDMKERYVTEMNYLYAGGYDEGRKQVAHRKKVVKMDEYGKILATYDSATEAANKNGITKHMVSKACLGRNSMVGARRTGKGYHYKYIEDGEKIKPEDNNG